MLNFIQIFLSQSFLRETKHRLTHVIVITFVY